MNVPLNALRRGRIVCVTVRDPNGYRKRRPAIIITPDRDISDSEPIVLMAITTTFPDPPPANHVALPWHPDPRRASTGLARRSAAVTNWLDTAYTDEIDDIIGMVPSGVMREIDKQLKPI